MKKYLILIILLLSITACKGKTYNVTFMDENVKLASVEIKKGGSIKNINTPEKEGYIFVSWLKDGIDYDPNTPITEDITLNATWVEIPNPTKSYTVTFNFGDYTKTASVKEGNKVAIPKEKPSKIRYKFLGWYLGDAPYDFDKEVTNDITINAKFVKDRLVIKYDLAGGTGTTIESEIDINSIPDKPKNPKRFGYNFTGWTLNGQTYNFDTPLSEDVTIKANWIAIVYYKVSFDTDGGELISSQMIVEGNTISVPNNPTKDGYVFKYWALNGTEFDINTKITKDITLSAIYEKATE